MKLQMDQLVLALGAGLDAVEKDFLGASTNHGARIATLCAKMGRALGLDAPSQTTVACCALLHDNALTEYLLSERPNSAREFNMVLHCVLGEDNASALPFPSPAAGHILHHHENADGSGPFGKREGEFSLGAQLISIADSLDSTFHLQWVAPGELEEIRRYIGKNTGRLYTQTAAKAMLEVLNEDMLASLRDERIHTTVRRAVPAWSARLSGRQLMNISRFICRIIDYKSKFTTTHSDQVANISWRLARHYGYSQALCAKVYFAGTLHDIGKLFMPTFILEKPGALTSGEYSAIQRHVDYTRRLLQPIQGLEDICAWASNHHEKLNGTGYPARLGQGQIDFISELVACADLYQAIGGARPYHPARSHTETMAILQGMAMEGGISPQIVHDINALLAHLPPDGVPSPDAALLQPAGAGRKG